jgi:hypothetical protein
MEGASPFAYKSWTSTRRRNDASEPSASRSTSFSFFSSSGQAGLDIGEHVIGNAGRDAPTYNLIWQLKWPIVASLFLVLAEAHSVPADTQLKRKNVLDMLKQQLLDKAKALIKALKEGRKHEAAIRLDIRVLIEYIAMANGPHPDPSWPLCMDAGPAATVTVAAAPLPQRNRARQPPMGCLHKLRRLLVDPWEWLVEFWATLSAGRGPVVADSYEAALRMRSVVKRKEAILRDGFLGHSVENPEGYWYAGYLNEGRVYRNPFLRAYSREKPPGCRELWSGRPLEGGADTTQRVRTATVAAARTLDTAIHSDDDLA